MPLCNDTYFSAYNVLCVSYYYAHSKTATGPAWDGKEEPRLLSVEARPTPSGSAGVSERSPHLVWISPSNVSLLVAKCWSSSARV